MADEVPAETPAETPPTPDPTAELAEARARLARIEQENAVYKQTLEVVQGQRTPSQPSTPQQDLGFDAQLVAAYRQRGFTDEQIRANLEILSPVLDYAGRQISSVIQRQEQELQKLRAQTDRKTFKHWDTLQPYVEEEQRRLAAQGLPADIKTAYAIAFTNHHDEVQKAEASMAQATAATRDVAAQANLASPRTTVVKEEPAAPKTVEEIAQLPPEERTKVWDALADRPF